MKWKCKRTGNVIDLPDYEEDNMKGHDQYEKVIEAKEEPSKKSSKKIVEDIDTDSI
jgi:hypothetical protein